MDKDVIKDYCLNIKSRTSKEDYIGGLELANRLVQSFPKSEKGYYYRGLCLFGLGKFEEAITNYDAALRIRPLYPKAYFNLGLCYQELHQYDPALINLGKALILFTNKGNEIAKDKCISAIRYVDVKREIE